MYDINYSHTEISESVDDHLVGANTFCANWCYYGIITVTDASVNGGSYYYHLDEGNYVETNVSKYTTWGELNDTFVAKYGKSSTGSSSEGNSFPAVCITVGIYQRKNGTSTPIFPPGIECLKPVTTNSCIISSDNIDLEHGEMAPSEIDGHVSSSNVVVSCGSPLPVKFSLAPGGDLSLKNGEISSHLTIDGKDIGTEMNLPKDRSDLTIKSTLKAEEPVTAGTFSGSQTLIMTVQ